MTEVIGIDLGGTAIKLGRFTEDGTCPTCGEALSAHDSLGDAAADALNAKAVKAPWHFKLMIAAIVLYLGFRAVQGIEWLVR